MTYRTLLLFCLLSSSAYGQFASPTTNTYRDIRVHVSFLNGESCDPTTRVVLLDRASTSVGQGTTDAGCVVEFSHVPAGTYHVVVSGRDFASTDSSDLVMNSPDTEELEVRVRRLGEPARLNGGGTPLVHVVDYKIPSRAKKEFQKAAEEMKNQQWARAIERLQKAVTICPSYASAYNNLGVAYARLGDHVHEREALQKAISIDDRLVPVYVNLAQMNMGMQNFLEAETALSKATELDPRDGRALVMLANVELMNHHFDEAIGTSRKVHTMLQPQHSTVHWVAAHAFVQKQQYSEAAAELKMFLSEETAGARANQVRKELAAMLAMPRVSPVQPDVPDAAPAR
jgi:cytochrome c-type biogenesis protein CcmH/NrfG